jgi:hypothetical protein
LSPDPNNSFDQRVEELFHQAIEMEDDARALFLAAACGGDEALRHAVSELIAASVRADASVIWNEPAIVHEVRSTASHENDCTGDPPAP